MTSTVTADLSKAPGQVAAMFDTVAPRYDLLNTVLSAGQVRVWRRAVRRALHAGPGMRILDVACGTGTSTGDLADTGASVVGVDFSRGMLATGRQRRPDLSLTAADAMRLPFADETFDAVTISFGIRNIVDVPAALREMLRVTRREGMLLVAEFSQPTMPVLSQVYRGGVLTALPWVASRLASNSPSYRYLAETIAEWPGQEEFALLIRDAGWDDPAWRNLTGGIVALHRAYRP